MRREGDTHEAGFYNNISYKTPTIRKKVNGSVTKGVDVFVVQGRVVRVIVKMLGMNEM